jgi:hypothetical protein
MEFIVIMRNLFVRFLFLLMLGAGAVILIGLVGLWRIAAYPGRFYNVHIAGVIACLLCFQFLLLLFI